MPEALALQEPSQDVDGQLVTDAHRLVPACRLAGLARDGQHAVRELDVRLAPRRGERVTQLHPVPRTTQGAVADGHLQALEDVLRLDQAVVGDDLQPVGRRDGGGRLLGALQRRGEHGGDVVVGELVGDALCLGGTGP